MIMRLSLLSLLLLSAAVPAFAQPVAEDQPEQAAPERPRFEPPQRAERSRPQDADASSFERPEPPRPRRAERFDAPPPPMPEPAREMRAERFDPPSPAPMPEPARAARAERFDAPAPPAMPRRERERARADRFDPSAGAVPEPSRPVERSAASPFPGDQRPTAATPDRRPADNVAGWRWRERDAERRSRNREVPPAAGSPVLGQSIPTPQTVTQPSADFSTQRATERQTFDQIRNRVGAEAVRQDQLRDARRAEAWRQDWRRDRRYDWRRHRDYDRSRFHLGIYIDPFGWRYRNWDVGWRLPSRYYSARYWIRDPYYYSLPPVYGPYRWIRYHDDVLLVDIRNGRVLDRIRNFFW